MDFKQLLKKGDVMLNNNEGRRTTISDIIYFYKQQLTRFDKIGLGNQTEFGTVVSEVLLSATRRRLMELQNRRDQLFFDARRANGAK